MLPTLTFLYSTLVHFKTMDARLFLYQPQRQLLHCIVPEVHPPLTKLAKHTVPFPMHADKHLSPFLFNSE